MFSPENLKYFCGSDLEEFLCCVALSGKKQIPNQSQQSLECLKLLSVNQEKGKSSFGSEKMLRFTVTLKETASVSRG